MNYMVLSDIHIGASTLKNELAITELILQEEYDKIILNGDIVDMWAYKYKEAIKSSTIIEALNTISKPIVWVRGNHDARITYSQGIIPKADVRDMCVELINGSNVLFMHGHQQYFLDNSTWLHALGTRLSYGIYSISGIDLGRLWRLTPIYKRGALKKRIEILRVHGEDVDNIVMGHTHDALNLGKLYDGGSITATGHYIFISDTGIHIRKLRR